MILQRLKITGLFDQFDYDIELNQEEKITILTAPNGYGKTMILNIIHKLFTWNKWENPDFFDNIIFKKIEYFFDQNTTIEILGNSNESFFKFKEFGKVEFEELSSERMLFLSSLNDSTQTFYSYLIEEQRLIKKYYYHSSEDESGYEVELRDTINENSKGVCLT